MKVMRTSRSPRQTGTSTKVLSRSADQAYMHACRPGQMLCYQIKLTCDVAQSQTTDIDSQPN